ncbi:MAG TPA: 6-hydroxymethylpterin diphosphokinase MptE-like protein [Candidatus Nitrosotenuis sp.]|nr:6-hydroxymethylpterin diphosphokinase MptE-like protein [Candidatus Nitrosotenuis sp.]
MTIRGWNSKYSQIVKEFGYSKEADLVSAALLNLILKNQFPSQNLRKLISGKPVFVIGAGPSLKGAIPVLKRHKKPIKICAETALDALVKNGIRPHIVVTDLDGNLGTLGKIGKTDTIFVVHAHGDNILRLGFAKNFKNCVGSTQTRKVGKIENFGGFTDGDRCVFLANHFGASRIFLLGMDFGPKIGRYSNTKRSERSIKLKKLRWGKMLLEWMAPMADAQLFTLSKQIEGFKKITWNELERLCRSPE